MRMGSPPEPTVRGVLCRRYDCRDRNSRIGDDFDGALDVEVLESFLQKILRDGRDAVALLDGKLGDGEIAAVLPTRVMSVP